MNSPASSASTLLLEDYEYTGQLFLDEEMRSPVQPQHTIEPCAQYGIHHHEYILRLVLSYFTSDQEHDLPVFKKIPSLQYIEDHFRHNNAPVKQCMFVSPNERMKQTKVEANSTQARFSDAQPVEAKLLGLRFEGKKKCRTLSHSGSDVKVWWLRGTFRLQSRQQFAVWRFGVNLPDEVGPHPSKCWYIHLVLPASPAQPIANQAREKTRSAKSRKIKTAELQTKYDDLVAQMEKVLSENEKLKAACEKLEAEKAEGLEMMARAREKKRELRTEVQSGELTQEKLAWLLVGSLGGKCEQDKEGA